jgi:arsenate reductase
VDDPAKATGSEAEIEAAFTTAYQILRRRIEAFLALPWTQWEASGDVALQAELARIGEQ